jgi:taurine dioxygenase|tara:strand:- start:17 stop:853 length:837 start_codon:yes stop_codon:yes gene_type:complete
LKITSIKKNWISEVNDIDCGNLSNTEKEIVYDLYATQKVVIFKNQNLNNVQLKEFCSIFGNVWDSSKEKYSGLNQSINRGHEDNFVETVSESGLLQSGTIPWHIDLTHFPSQLLPNRILYAIELEGEPTGTKFVDTIQGLHLIDNSVREFLKEATALCKAPYTTPWDCYVRRPAINWHPVHNDYGLVADELFTQWIDGLPEGTNYIEWFRNNIINKMISDETTYLHNWSIGDLVIYDNWSTIHYRDAFIGKRKLKRVTWDQDWCKYIGNRLTTAHKVL